jgi:hypothetical protein
MQHVEIRVKGHLDPDWSEWLEDLTITHSPENVTCLRGTVADQTALYGLLTKLRDLGLALLSVTSSDAGNTRCAGAQAQLEEDF